MARIRKFASVLRIRMKNILSLILIVGLFSYPFIAYADVDKKTDAVKNTVVEGNVDVDVEGNVEETIDSENKSPFSVFTNVSNIADNAQRATTDRFNRFVLSIDGFFGGAESTGEANRSWGRLRLDGIDPDDDSFRMRGRLKLRVVLPRSKRRLRLLLSTEDEDLDTNRSSSSVDGEADEQNVALALRFVRSLSDQISLKFDVGARVRDSKAQIFGRVSASNFQVLRWGVEQKISNNFFLFSSSGYRNRFNYDIRRPLQRAANVFLRSSTTLEGRKGVRGIAINETLGLYADLNSHTAVAFEGLFNWVSSEDDEVNENFLGSEFRVRFRQNIWRPWFYYEIWPSVSFPASSNYEREFGGRVRVEMSFGQY